MSDVYVEVTLVHAPACHFCDDAQEVLARIAETYPLRVERVEAISPRGQQLMRTHRAAMSPLVLVDGAFFSSGRLPRRKLTQLLDQRAGAPGATKVG